MDTFVDSSWYQFRFTAPNARDADRQEGRSILGAGRPVHRRQGARGAAPALRALLHARHEGDQAPRRSTSRSQSMFTQGIVVHETYRSENGDWLTPAEVRIEGEGTERKATSHRHRPAGRDRRHREDVEVAQERGRSRRHHRQLRRRHGPAVHRLRQPARSRHHLDRGRRRRRRPPGAAHLPGDRPGAPSANTPRTARPPAFGPEAIALRRAAHKTLNSVGQNIEGLRYNVAVAQIYELDPRPFGGAGQVRRRPRLGHPRGRRAAGADDRPNAAAFGGRLLGAAWIQHPACRSALAAGRRRRCSLTM